MTLGNLPLSMSAVASELETSLPLSINNPRCLNLAGVSSAPNSMSNFANKTGITLLANPPASALGTNHSFAGVNFGVPHAGRKLMLLVWALQKPSGIAPGSVILSNISVGGVSATDLSLAYWQNGSGSTLMVALGMRFVVVPTGSTGTISMTSPFDTRIVVRVLYIPEAFSTFDSGANSAGSGTQLITTADVPANGAAIVMAARTSNTDNINMVGVNANQIATAVAGAFRCEAGWQNKMSAQNNRNFGFNGGSVSAIGVTGVLTLQP